MIRTQAFHTVSTGENILTFSGDTLPLTRLMDGASILIHEVGEERLFSVVHL